MANRFTTITPAEVWPVGWDTLLTPHPIGIGYDPATTQKEKSNPSGICIAQKVGSDFIVRSLVRFKTNDPELARAVLDAALTAIFARNLRVRKLCIDATSERYFAADLRKSLVGKVRVELVVSSESIEHLGEKMLMKAYLGNLYVNTIEDGHLLLPNEPWVARDARSVKRDRGSFENELDEEGNHGDGFDATKLAIHALTRASGAASAEGAQVGSFGARGNAGRVLKNPYAAKSKNRRTLNA